MNTARLNTCHTAARLRDVLKVIREESVEHYGRGTPESAAFEVLLQSDAQRVIDQQIKNLNEVLVRTQRELAEWLAMLPPAKVGIGG